MTPRSRALAHLHREHREIRTMVLLLSVSGAVGISLGLLAAPVASVLELDQLLLAQAVGEHWSLMCGAAIALLVGASTD